MADDIEERVDNVVAYMEKIESRVDQMANMHSDGAETRQVLADCVDELDSRLDDVERGLDLVVSEVDEFTAFRDDVEEVLGALMPDPTPTDERVEDLEAEVERLRRALREISQGEGTFSRDPLEHAENVIENQVDIAERALNNDTDR